MSRQMLKRFLVYFVIVFIVFLILIFLLKRYDFDWSTINWINSNKFYLLILGISLAVCLSIYGDESAKSKFLLYFIIIINCLYLCFLFVVWNIWLSQTEWLIMLAFLICWFIWIYIKNWLWYTILSVSLIWSLIILWLWFIPMFEKWPDFQWFENTFENKMLIYSNFEIDEDNTQVVKDNKIYNIDGWLSIYDFKIKNFPSQIVFKSDKFYDDVYCFIVFKWWNFVEISPQSAITIADNFEIDVLTWVVKYYGDLTNFSFSWWSIEQETSENIINIVKNWYNDSFRLYLKAELWLDLLYNESILKISKKTLTLLSKIFPWKYENNLKNLQDYVDVFWVDLDNSFDSSSSLNTTNILNNMRWGAKKGVDMIEK